MKEKVIEEDKEWNESMEIMNSIFGNSSNSIPVEKEDVIPAVPLKVNAGFVKNKNHGNTGEKVNIRIYLSRNVKLILKHLAMYSNLSLSCYIEKLIMEDYAERREEISKMIKTSFLDNTKK